MQAVTIAAYGNNDVVAVTQAPRPAPQAGEVLVKIHAAGVNPVDWKIRNGAGQRMGLTLPIALGGEISGTVVQLGAGVDAFRVGDAVYGIIRCGGFADYAVAPAADLAHKPASLDVIAAAAVPLGALTAWQAMFDVAGLASGQRLLITGGSGGVGSLAIQLAKAAGAHVTAMASARNEAFVRSLGADAIASRAATSVRTISRLFLAETGLSFKVWRQRARIVQAMDRLGRGKPIAHVATELGFASTASFSAAFRQVTAMTPTEFLARAP